MDFIGAGDVPVHLSDGHVGPICSVKNWSPCGTIITPLRVRHGVSGDAAFARCGGCFKGTARGNDAFYDQNMGL